jgi:hypothetical protein
MASTYSDLKIELIGTGDQTGTWGTTTNNNFSIALSEAITGSADVSFSSADVTITLTNTNGAQTARNLRLNLTGTSGGARQLILGSGCQIEKLYLINNGLADAVTVKNTGGTGIVVPAGSSMFVYNNGTDVVEALKAIPVAAGGTGLATLTANNVVLGNGTSAVQFVAPGSNGNVLTSNGSTWASTTPAGAGNLTGAVTSVGLATSLGSFSSANLLGALTDETGTGVAVFATSPTLVTPLLGTPTSGNLSNCTADGTDAVGFKNIPQNSQSAAYTLVLADAGKHIFHPVADNNARTFTIPANSSVAYPIGTAITFINMAVANVTIAITTDTLTLSPAGTSGSRTLATNGSATCIKITSTQWLISGSGLT